MRLPGSAVGVAPVGGLARPPWPPMFLSRTSTVRRSRDVAGRSRTRDLPQARRFLPALVGRDPARLDAAEISRAVVESLAENTVDALVAPVFWAASSVRRELWLSSGQHHGRLRRLSQRPLSPAYGWASARLDDLANFIPARLTAALVIAVRPRAARAVWRAVRQHAPFHPSPNSGVAEAAFAAALGLRLGGVNTYGSRTERRPQLGAGRAPQAGDILAAAALSRDVTFTLIASLLALRAAA